MKQDLCCENGVTLWWRNNGLKSFGGYRAIKWVIDVVELEEHVVRHKCIVGYLC